jgi:capsular polysaccharide biosynthesis protein
MTAPPASDLDAEREIDLSRWRDAVVDRWWVVAAGVVAGIVVGALYSLSGGSVYQASVLVAPGQAFSPSGAPVLNYLSSPRGINDLVTEESTLAAAARKAGINVGQLRGHVSTQSINTGAGTTAARGAVLVKITVQNQHAKATTDAANALGAIVVSATTSGYVRSSVGVLATQIAGYKSELNSLSTLIRQQNKALATQTLDPLSKLILVSGVNNAELRQSTISNNLATAQQQLQLAKTIEYAQIITRAPHAVKTTARSRRNSVLVGALIGLIVGAIVAIALGTREPRVRPA